MKPTKGLSLDTRPEDQPDGTYPFGKNGIQNSIKGAVINEPGFEEILKQVILPGYQCNGILTTDTNKIIVFFTNNTYSCIRVVDTETGVISFDFTDQTKPYRLGFNVDNYIVGQVQRNYAKELVCAFTDKNTFPKFINFDDPQIDQLREWNLFPEAIFPGINKTVINGGYLSVGSYFFAVRYRKIDGTVTGFSEVSSGVAIIVDQTQNSTVIADKSIQLTFTNADLTYDFLEVAVISKIGGVTKASLLNKIAVLPGPINTVFSGAETITTLTLEEVLINPIFYDRVATMGQLNDALYIGRLERTNEILDMQPYANLIQLFWTSELIDVENCPLEHKMGVKKGFMHGETYAFYIRYKLANGSCTVAYHIPGATASALDLSISGVGTTGSVGNAPVFKMEDSISTNFDSTALGGVDLSGERIRHHKMPSLKWCHQNLYLTETLYGTKKLDLLGIKAVNVIIPPKYSSIITGYEILYAKRNLQNMTIYGQSLALYGSTFPTSLQDPGVWSNGGNFFNIINYNQNFLRFHAFDILFNKPGISPSFTAAQYKLTIPYTKLVTEYSYNYGSSLGASGTGYRIITADAMAGTVTTAPTNNVNAVVDTKYVFNGTLNSMNVVVGSNNFTYYDNRYLETCYTGRLQGPALPIAPYEAYLTNLCDIKSNIYENFYTQELVSAGDSKVITDSSPFWGGDIFLSQYSFHTYGILDYYFGVQVKSGVDFSLDMRGIRIANRVICETVANLYTRYEISGNVYSKWWPYFMLGAAGSPLTNTNYYLLDFRSSMDPNQFGYTKGAEAINDFLPDEIYNPYQKYISKYPYRIHRGGKISRETTRSWRTFLPLDYYEMQKNMGVIEHIEGMDDRLLIHLTNALFVTQDKGKLEGGMLTVTLGAGDIFQFEPQEVVSSKLGYAGVQTDLAVIRTPVGYVFPDVKQGEFYLYKNKELTYMNESVYRFLKEYLTINGKNPFTGNGVTLGWDQKYKRILATVKNWRPANQSQSSVIIINGPEDILEVFGMVGEPTPSAPLGIVYHDCLKTTNGIVKPGDIVFMNGRYQTYYGINNVTPGAESDYNCPTVPGNCDAPGTPTITTTIDPISAHITWTGTAWLYHWELYEVTSGGLVYVTSSGSSAYANTSSNFMDFDGSVIQADKIYEFQLWAICEDGTEMGIYSDHVANTFSIPAPPEIIVEPSGSTVINYHPSKTSAGTYYKYRLIVNGTTLGVYPFSYSTGIGPSQYITTSGSLTNATIRMELLDNSNNPLSLTGISPQPMLNSSYGSVPGVVTLNYIITWTGVDISPAFIAYVHLYFN
jgi:hypothetical protein